MWPEGKRHMQWGDEITRKTGKWEAITVRYGEATQGKKMPKLELSQAIYMNRGLHRK